MSATIIATSVMSDLVMADTEKKGNLPAHQAVIPPYYCSGIFGGPMGLIQQ